jgi:hypothetical protein
MTNDNPTDITPLGVVTYRRNADGGWWTARLGTSYWLGAFDTYERARTVVRLMTGDLRGAKLYEADLTEAHLRGADLTEADLGDACLRGVDLAGADLTHTYLSGADMSGADLSGAILVCAIMTDVDLSRADLRGTDLRGARLTDCTMTDAVYDADTIFPWGFDPDLGGAPGGPGSGGGPMTYSERALAAATSTGSPTHAGGPTQ